MKCPNCCSPMLVIDETANPKSHVTFYRCSICNGIHDSAVPVAQPLLAEQHRHAEAPAALVANPLMV